MLTGKRCKASMAGAAAEEASTFAGGSAISNKEAAGVPLAEAMAVVVVVVISSRKVKFSNNSVALTALQVDLFATALPPPHTVDGHTDNERWCRPISAQ